MRISIKVGYENNYKNIFSPRANEKDTIELDISDYDYECLRYEHSDKEYDRVYDGIINAIEDYGISDDDTTSWYIDSIKKI